MANSPKEVTWKHDAFLGQSRAKKTTIENPMVTGGAPNNTLTLLKFEKAARSKNPFNYKDRLYEDPLNKEKAGVGPGLYSPQQSGQIGGSDLEKLKIRVN